MIRIAFAIASVFLAVVHGVALKQENNGRSLQFYNEEETPSFMEIVDHEYDLAVQLNSLNLVGVNAKSQETISSLEAILDPTFRVTCPLVGTHGISFKGTPDEYARDRFLALIKFLKDDDTLSTGKVRFLISPGTKGRSIIMFGTGSLDNLVAVGRFRVTFDGRLGAGGCFDGNDWVNAAGLSIRDEVKRDNLMELYGQYLPQENEALEYDVNQIIADAEAIHKGELQLSYTIPSDPAFLDRSHCLNNVREALLPSLQILFEDLMWCKGGCEEDFPVLHVANTLVDSLGEDFYMTIIAASTSSWISKDLRYTAEAMFDIVVQIVKKVGLPGLVVAVQPYLRNPLQWLAVALQTHVKNSPFLQVSRTTDDVAGKEQTLDIILQYTHLLERFQTVATQLMPACDFHDMHELPPELFEMAIRPFVEHTKSRIPGSDFVDIRTAASGARRYLNDSYNPIIRCEILDADLDAYMNISDMDISDAEQENDITSMIQIDGNGVSRRLNSVVSCIVAVIKSVCTVIGVVIGVLGIPQEATVAAADAELKAAGSTVLRTITKSLAKVSAGETIGKKVAALCSFFGEAWEILSLSMMTDIISEAVGSMSLVDKIITVTGAVLQFLAWIASGFAALILKLLVLVADVANSIRQIYDTVQICSATDVDNKDFDLTGNPYALKGAQCSAAGLKNQWYNCNLQVCDLQIKCPDGNYEMCACPALPEKVEHSQYCKESMRWYSCESPHCDLGVSCESNSGLFSCACPKADEKIVAIKIGERCLDLNGHMTELFGKVHMWDCDTKNPNQRWMYDPTLKQIRYPGGYCLDAKDRATPEGVVHMYGCDDTNPNQQWELDVGLKRIKNAADNGICLSGDPTKNLGLVNMMPCDDSSPNQQWEMVTNVVAIKIGERCLDVNGHMTELFGKVHMWDCDTNNSNQRWKYDPALKQIRYPGGYCLDAKDRATPEGVVAARTCLQLYPMIQCVC